MLVQPLHRSTTLILAVMALAALLLAAAAVPARVDAAPKGPQQVRFATFNASLNRNVAGQLVADLSTPNNAQARTVRTNPSVGLIVQSPSNTPSAVKRYVSVEFGST